MLSLCWMPTPPPPLPFSCVSFLIRFISHHQHKSASCASLSRDSCTQCLIVIVFQFHLHWCAYPCWTLYCAFARAFQCSMLWWLSSKICSNWTNEWTNEILTCLQSASKNQKLFPIHHRSPIFSIYWESTDFSSLKAVYYENRLTHKFGMGKMRWLNCVSFLFSYR